MITESPTRILIHPHCLPAYIERVACRPISLSQAETELAASLQAPLFEMEIGPHSAKLVGCINPFGKRFLAYIRSGVAETVGPAWFWHEARPLWRQHGWNPKRSRPISNTTAPSLPIDHQPPHAAGVTPSPPHPLTSSPSHPLTPSQQHRLLLPQLHPYERRYLSPPRTLFSVTALLRDNSPIVSYDPICLDNLLARAVVDEAFGPAGIPPSSIPYALPIPLRALYRSTENIPLYAASTFAPDTEAIDDTIYWHKRAQDGRFTRSPSARFNINTSAGRWMERRVPVPVRIASRWTALAWGDPAETLRLLQSIAFLGKKRAIGFGEVREWIVQPVAEIPDKPSAAYLILIREGRLSASIPLGAEPLLRPHTPQGALTPVGWSPPQWKPALFAPGWRVGTALT